MNTEQNKLKIQLSPNEGIKINNSTKVLAKNKGEIRNLKTQYDAILYFLEQMDTEMIQMILENDKSIKYYDKSILIKKLSYAMETFFDKGDTHFVKQNGYCKSKTCNFKCKGYSFIGNKSGFYTDVVFKETEDDYVDIFNCNNIQNEEENLEKIEVLFISILNVDKVNFPHNLEYALLGHRCEKAVYKLTRNQPTLLSRFDMKEWLKLNSKLLDEITLEIHGNGFRSPFLDISSLFRYIFKALEWEDQVVNALLEFDLLEIENELDLLKWLVKHEKIGLDTLMFVNLLFGCEMTKSGYYPLKYDTNLLIDKNEFEVFSTFHSAHNDTYFEMIKKYKSDATNNTAYRSEVNLVDNDGKPDALSYHLKNRGLL